MTAEVMRAWTQDNHILMTGPVAYVFDGTFVQ